MQGYCLSERKKVEMLNPKKVTMKNGRTAYRGKDAKGHNIYKIGK